MHTHLVSLNVIISLPRIKYCHTHSHSYHSIFIFNNQMNYQVHVVLSSDILETDKQEKVLGQADLVNTFCRCINPFPNKPLFLHVCSKSLENTLEKREIAGYGQLLLFQQCFLSFWRNFCQGLQI